MITVGKQFLKNLIFQIYDCKSFFNKFLCRIGGRSFGELLCFVDETPLLYSAAAEN